MSARRITAAAALLAALVLPWAPARAASLQENVSQAVSILERFKDMPEEGFPEAVLRDAPSAIGTGGAGFGFQVGAAVSEFVVILNTADAVKAFSRGGNVSIGGDITAAIGPVGRNLGADVLPVAAVYTYSRSQGLFAGVSLQGSVIATRDDANTEDYGRMCVG